MMVLPFPPSINHYWRHVGAKVLVSEEGRRYRKTVADLALVERWPRHGDKRVSVGIEAWMPDKRRRDLDNLLKPLLDCLTHAGVWDDDSQIDSLSISRAPMIGGMVKVWVTPC